MVLLKIWHHDEFSISLTERRHHSFTCSQLHGEKLEDVFLGMHLNYFKGNISSLQTFSVKIALKLIQFSSKYREPFILW